MDTKHMLAYILHVLLVSFLTAMALQLCVVSFQICNLLLQRMHQVLHLTLLCCMKALRLGYVLLASCTAHAGTDITNLQRDL